MAVKSGAEFKPLEGSLGVCVAMRVYEGCFRLHQVVYFVSGQLFSQWMERNGAHQEGFVWHTRSFL